VSAGPRLAVENKGSVEAGEAGTGGWRLRTDECPEGVKLVP
jgi:hypothetical protein